jgi:hypothetical protein
MIEEAIVDAYERPEQVAGFGAMLEEHLAVPFKTEVLGVAVTVQRVDVTADGQIVAVCSRGRFQQRIPILDLPLPVPRPSGAGWIEAYRRWTRGG